MPTIARQPKAKEPAGTRRIAGTRLGDGSMVGAAAPPPEVLLPSGTGQKAQMIKLTYK